MQKESRAEEESGRASMAPVSMVCHSNPVTIRTSEIINAACPEIFLRSREFFRQSQPRLCSAGRHE